MKELYKIHLFSKHILVKDFEKEDTHAFESVFAFANLLGIRIVKGKEYACPELISFAASRLGEWVPQPFYKGFPATVRELSPEALLFDQLLHYFCTYGLNCFDEPRYSVMEREFERCAFKEEVEPKDFSILSEAEAEGALEEYIKNLLSSSRPLNDYQYALVLEALGDYGYAVESCPCKDTVIRLMLDTRNTDYARLLQMPDFIRLVESINFYLYKNKNPKKLNLKNRDRVFLCKILDSLFERGDTRLRDCFEKQQAWCAYLHHLHYKPKCGAAEEFLRSMREERGGSAYAPFEAAMEKSDIKGAVTSLIENKGSAAFMRKLNYILSRCTTEDEVSFVVESIKTKNNIVLIQLMLQYANYRFANARSFKFPRFGSMKVHGETAEEIKRRRSVISQKTIERVVNAIKANLERNLSARLGKVYVDEKMKNIALPIQESTSQGGFGTLPRGSRLDIPEGKKLRAFTYWEKVNDIDLSIIGINDRLEQLEFSWRTMAYSQSDALTFSGDETSGYDGGSEYFDLELEKLKKLYPDIRYYILCNNVYSGTDFSDCLCKAGFMIRDEQDSGEIFEPKTVTSSYIVNCPSTFAYMYAIDTKTRQVVWLNMARASSATVAGTTAMDFLLDYFNATEVVNMHSLFTMMATEVVSDPKDADIVLSDGNVELKEGAILIRSCDTDKILPIING